LETVEQTGFENSNHMPNANFTTAPVESSTGTDPEFTDFRGLESMFTIRRSNAYAAIQAGDIESVVLRRKGKIKGRRLINVESVRKWLASQSDDVDPVMRRNARKANRASLKSKEEKRKANGA
jgi:hypothetical protein